MCVMSWTKAYVTRQHSVNVTYAYLLNCCSSNNEIVFICRLGMRLSVLSLLWFTTKTAICIFIKKCSAPFRQGRWEVCSRLFCVSQQLIFVEENASLCRFNLHALWPCSMFTICCQVDFNTLCLIWYRKPISDVNLINL